MFPPFAIGAASAPVARQTPALRERTETRSHPSALVASRLSCLPPTLNQNSIDIALPVRPYLIRSDRTTYELHIVPGKGEGRTGRSRMHEPRHLLIPHKEDRVLMCCSGSDGGVVDD